MSQVNPFDAPQSRIVYKSEYSQTTGLFNSYGRQGRIRYLSNLLILSLIAAVVMFFLALMLSPMMMLQENVEFGIVGFISLIFMYPYMCQSIKRAHDIGWTGWTTVLLFVPLLNTLFSFILMLMPGSKGDNNYGGVPLPPSGLRTGIVLFVYLAIPLLTIVGIMIVIGAGLAPEFAEALN